jgi:hypothetical protein
MSEPVQVSCLKSNGVHGVIALPKRHRFSLLSVRHQTLRVTPAMEAGVSDHIWSLDEIVRLLH